MDALLEAACPVLAIYGAISMLVGLVVLTAIAANPATMTERERWEEDNAQMRALSGREGDTEPDLIDADDLH